MKSRVMLAVLCAAMAVTSFAQAPPAPAAHNMMTSAQVVWGPGPTALPPGSQLAVMTGDPGGTGPFTIRAKLPAGYRIPPHWHPTDENVTVLSGTVAMGMGEKFEAKALMVLPVGGFAAMAPNARHFFVARTAATIQIHGTGPFAVTYVNPADDPRMAPAK